MLQKKVVQKIKEHIFRSDIPDVFNNQYNIFYWSKHTCYFQYLFTQAHDVYGVMWVNNIQPERPQMTKNVAHAHRMLDT